MRRIFGLERFFERKAQRIRDPLAVGGVGAEAVAYMALLYEDFCVSHRAGGVFACRLPVFR